MDYTKVNVFEALRRDGEAFDLIFDTIGAGSTVWHGASSGVLAAGGQLVTITGDVQREMDASDWVVKLLVPTARLASSKATGFPLSNVSLRCIQLSTSPNGGARLRGRHLR